MGWGCDANENKTLQTTRLKKSINSTFLKLLHHLQTELNTLSLAQKRHLETVLVNLKSLKLQAAHECLKIPITAKGLCLCLRGKSTPKAVKVNQLDRIEWCDVATAFKGRIRTGVVINKTHKSPRSFLEDVAVVIERLIGNCMRNSMANIKVNLVFCGLFERLCDNAEEVLEYLNIFQHHIPPSPEAMTTPENCWGRWPMAFLQRYNASYRIVSKKN